MHKFSLCAYSDSDWTSDPYDKISTLRSCVYFGPNLIAWSSKKQLIVAHSSMKEEYSVLAHTISEVLWIESLLNKLNISYLTPILICDNLIVVMLSYNLILHARTKHIKLDIKLVCELVVVQKL